MPLRIHKTAKSHIHWLIRSAKQSARNIVLLAMALLLLTEPCKGAATDLLALASNKPLQELYYHQLQHSYEKRQSSDQFDATTGASGHNVAWEKQTPGAVPYIEQQRYASDLIQAGIALHDQALINQGTKGLAFAFDKMIDANGQPASDDPIHSFGLFAESAAKAMLLLRLSGNEPKFVSHYLPKLALGVTWWLAPDQQNKFRPQTEKFTHRAWYAAELLATMPELTGDNKYAKLSDHFARVALSEHHDGINPERGGFDVNYQMVGTVFAERFYCLTKSASLRDQTKEMIAHSLNFEAKYILPDGTIDTTGSAREGHELTRSGKVKTPETKAFLEGFTYGAAILNNPQFDLLASRIAANK